MVQHEIDSCFQEVDEKAVKGAVYAEVAHLQIEVVENIRLLRFLPFFPLFVYGRLGFLVPADNLSFPLQVVPSLKVAVGLFISMSVVLVLVDRYLASALSRLSICRNHGRRPALWLAV